MNPGHRGTHLIEFRTSRQTAMILDTAIDLANFDAPEGD